MNITPSAVMKWRDMTSLDRALLLLSLLCGIYYLIAPFALPSELRNLGPLSPIMKGLAVSPLAVLAFRLQKDTDGKFLGMALLLGSIGDVLLALKGYFVFGLVSFLIGHLFYITLWTRHRPALRSLSSGKKLLTAILIAFLVFMLWWQLPVPDLSIPLTIYMCVLTAMAITAVRADFKGNWIIAGAVLFLISDSLIGASSFKHFVTGKLAGFLIWSTYYLAQYFLGIGFLGQKRAAR